MFDDYLHSFTQVLLSQCNAQIITKPGTRPSYLSEECRPDKQTESRGPAVGPVGISAESLDAAAVKAAERRKFGLWIAAMAMAAAVLFKCLL